MGDKIRFASFASIFFLVILLSVMAIVSRPAMAGDELVNLKREATVLFEQGKYDLALDIAQRMLALAERKFEPNELSVAAPLNMAGQILSKLGRLTDSEPLLRNL